MTDFFRIRCPKCGAFRSPDLKVPCDLCGSRFVPILGYTYQQEIIAFLVIMVMLTVILIAFLIGAIYIYIKYGQL